MPRAISTACSGASIGSFQPGMVLTPASLASFFGGDFVAHGGDGVVLRADEDQPFFLDAAGELLVFGQETVARVNGLGSRGLGRGNDFVGDQVALAAGGRPEQHGLVGQTDMAGFTIRLGVHRDGGDAHLPRGSDDAAGDLAAVGNQDFFEHGVRSPCLTAECCRACATGCRASCP